VRIEVPPLVAVQGDRQCIAEQERYTGEAVPINTIERVVGALPLIIPPLGDNLDIDALLARIDGVMVPGGLTNVHPSLYGGSEETSSGPYDQDRDLTSLPLIKAALARGVPLLMACRGLQELNVALGGTLKDEPDDLTEDKKHGTPESADSENARFALRQIIELTPGGMLARLIGAENVRVNSLHSQLIDKLGPGLTVESRAEDGTIEAVSVDHAKSFALGVMFHPEYWAEHDPPSLKILRAFADAVRRYADRKRTRPAAEAA
jgi:putative glutamine amidotransferase